jgi:hypothetical protein
MAAARRPKAVRFDAHLPFSRRCPVTRSAPLRPSTTTVRFSRYPIFVELRVLYCEEKQLSDQKSRLAPKTSTFRTMTEVIRDEEVRRRIRLAQEFLDPGMHGLRFKWHIY